ncbi:homoaconitate hydratase [Chloroflexus sp.]|uniref:LeuD/DmdB family oxidoreductase small subunit n=1 Tax=Chloroflexus sp. TaxID=1904827 RepID=UPI00298F3966|nr:homoaconitate hydratase [Chloroflexus sp.]MCS6887726.1 homoaconitate hydratase [Chloroflexus sp.]MCX7859971.1 homoaconitate hydratase [Chloroflexus sp.]MDW8403941.1 homoaconitate hydratase [Chloroflexus sp.]
MARVWLFGPDINTDQIVPGRYAPYMLKDESELRRYPFIEHRPDFAPNVRPGDIIVAGKNFGCGSSREYAPLALRMVGIGAIIAPLFARIFFRNALNLGIPCFTADLTHELADGDEVELDLESGRITTSTGRVIHLPPPPLFLREVWAAGGIVPFYRQYGRFPGEVA